MLGIQMHCRSSRLVNFFHSEIASSQRFAKLRGFTIQFSGHVLHEKIRDYPFRTRFSQIPMSCQIDDLSSTCFSLARYIGTNTSICNARPDTKWRILLSSKLGLPHFYIHFYTAEYIQR